MPTTMRVCAVYDADPLDNRAPDPGREETMFDDMQVELPEGANALCFYPGAVPIIEVRTEDGDRIEIARGSGDLWLVGTKLWTQVEVCDDNCVFHGKETK